MQIVKSSFHLDHDPIVLRQIQREQIRRQMFGEQSRVNKDSVESSTSQESHGQDGQDGTLGGRQLPNRIRRLRSRHIKFDPKLWFYGHNPWSFNSRCPSSKRFDVSDLDPESR